MHTILRHIILRHMEPFLRAALPDQCKRRKGRRIDRYQFAGQRDRSERQCDRDAESRASQAARSGRILTMPRAKAVLWRPMYDSAGRKMLADRGDDVVVVATCSGLGPPSA
jgi:hypothetical protein